MKVGDYVRTKNGYISKYIGKNKTPYTIGKHLSFETTIRDVRFEETDNDTMIWEGELEKGLEEIIKSSPNIIDLIEIGDYVNGTKVTMIAGTRYDKNDLHCYCDYSEDKETGKWIMIPAKDIKSIVTKEQFESCEYKL
jgi:hypothetical protein